MLENIFGELIVLVTSDSILIVAQSFQICLPQNVIFSTTKNLLENSTRRKALLQKWLEPIKMQ